MSAILFSCLWISNLAHGKFYAPDTEYHDPVQRVFVVEAARVLAALENLRGTNFAQVTYQVTTKLEIIELMNTLHAKGGSLATVRVMQYLDALGDDIKCIPRGAELQYQFAETLPQPTRLYVKALYNRKFRYKISAQKRASPG